MTPSLPEKDAPLSALTHTVSFYPFNQACPICGAWIDVVTKVHCEKHNMTRGEFLLKYVMIANDVELATIVDPIEGATVASVIKAIAANNIGKWFSARYLSAKIGAKMGTLRIELARLEKDGYLYAKKFKVNSGYHYTNVQSSRLENFYTLKGDVSK